MAQWQEATEGQGKALVPLQERRINFHGDELVVVLVEIEGERQVYVPVRQFCDYLGLNWSAQYRRIGRDEELRDATTSVAVMATLVSDQHYKQRYNAICLQLEMLPGWLFGVTPSRVKPEYQERIRLYRKKCYRVLWDAFLRGELFPEEGAVVVPSTVETTVVPSDDPRINALTEQIDTLTAMVAFLREHRQALVRCKAHTEHERYTKSDINQEITPIAIPQGTRTYLHMKPFVLIPDIILTVGLYRNPGPGGAVGEVLSSQERRQREVEIGNMQGWSYPDNTLVLWECFLHDFVRHLLL